jgi:hypothetical protein
MNMKLFLILMLAALCALFIVPLMVAFARKAGPFFSARARRRNFRRVALANAELAFQCRRENVRLKADAAVTRYLLVKFGSDGEHAAICGAADIPLGNSDDSPGAAEDPFTVQLFGLIPSERIVIASEAITVGEAVYTAANGKVLDLPAGAGTYYQVGYASQAAAADGDKFRIVPCFPIKTVIP